MTAFLALGALSFIIGFFHVLDPILSQQSDHVIVIEAHAKATAWFVAGVFFLVLYYGHIIARLVARIALKLKE